MSAPHQPERQPSLSPEDDELERLRERVRRLLRHLEDVEEELKDKEGILRRVVEVFLALSRQAATGRLLSLMDDLASALRADFDRDRLETSLNRIKRELMHEDERVGGDRVNQSGEAAPTEVPTDDRPMGKSGAPRVELRSQSVDDLTRGSRAADPPALTPTPRETEQPRASGALPPEVEDRVRKLLHLVLDQLAIDGEPAWNASLADVRVRSDCEDLIAGLGETAEQLAGLIARRLEMSREERERIEAVLRVTLAELGEIEASLLSEVRTNQQQWVSDNASFIEGVELKLDDLSQARRRDTLAAIRDLIDTRVSQLKGVIAVKREADARRSADFEAKVRHLEEELERAGEQISSISRQASHDPGLEEIYNRRALDREIERELAQLDPDGKPFSLILVDLDHFKRVNDSHGHQIGDALLKALVLRLRRGLKSTDFLARYGGDEFAILLSRTSLEGATGVADRLRELVASDRFAIGELSLVSSLSAGVTAARAGDTLEQLISRADAALYRAKRERNCVRTEDAGDEDQTSAPVSVARASDGLTPRAPRHAARAQADSVVSQRSLGLSALARRGPRLALIGALLFATVGAALTWTLRGGWKVDRDAAGAPKHAVYGIDHPARVGWRFDAGAGTEFGVCSQDLLRQRVARQEIAGRDRR